MTGRLFMKGWRGFPMLGFAAALVVTLPQARALITVGLLGGVLIGLALILIRRQTRPSGPRRGTPIVLFPRPANLSVTGA
jgi:hypothetical protein